MAEYKLVQPQQPQPQMIEIDCTKCKSIEELGMLMNGLGLAVTEEWAKQNNLEHILVKQPEPVKLNLPDLEPHDRM